jgi:hypothetical protein
VCHSTGEYKSSLSYTQSFEDIPATNKAPMDAPPLADELLKWAKGYTGDATDWLHELEQQKIRDLQTMDEMDLESFEVLLGALKARNQAVLIQKLKIWYKEKHPESQFSSNTTAKILGKRNYRVSELFPDNFRVDKKTRSYYDDGLEGKIYEVHLTRSIEMRDFPPMVNKNPKYGRVYVRRCYITLFDELVKLIREGRFNAMITGNPGTGKSYFYLYVIFRFIKNPSLLGNWRLVINSGEQFHILNGDVFESIHPLEIQLNKDILRLVDGKTSPGQLTGWDGSTILFASPSNTYSENKPSHLMKNYESYYFFMPVWDDEELKDANRLLDPSLQQSELELMEKVDLAGHIPRFVLLKDTTLEMLRIDIKAEITSENMLDLLKFVEAKQGVRDKHYSHRMLKMSPNRSSRSVRADFSLDFLSREISRLALFEAKEQVIAEFKRFALENNDPDSAKFRGNVYEHLVHRHFKHASLPQILSGKRLDDGSTFNIPFPSPIFIGAAFHKLDDIVLTGNQATYAFPASKTQGAYDSFLWNGVDTCYVFQITIAEKHSILNQPVKKFIEWIKKFNISDLSVKFVFIVPTAKINQWNQPQNLVKSGEKDYQKKAWMVEIDQYVVSLDI